MAINYNDPYNQGIGTPDLGNMNVGQGNMNLGQVPVNNMQQANWLNTISGGMLGTTPEQDAQNATLEQIQDLRNQEQQINALGEGAQYLKQDELKSIQKQIQELKNQYPEVESIQSAFLDDDEYDFSGIERQTALLDPFSLFALLKGGATKSQIGKHLLINKLQKETGKIIGPPLKRKIRQLQGEKYGGSGRFKNIPTGSKDYGPHTKPTIKSYVAPRGPHSSGPPSGRRPDKSGATGTRAGGFTNPGKGSYGPHKAYGGRVSYFDGGLLSLWPR